MGTAQRYTTIIHYVVELESSRGVSENVVDYNDSIFRVLGPCSISPSSLSVGCRWQSLEMSLLGPWSRVRCRVGAASVSERHFVLYVCCIRVAQVLNGRWESWESWETKYLCSKKKLGPFPEGRRREIVFSSLCHELMRRQAVWRKVREANDDNHEVLVDTG